MTPNLLDPRPHALRLRDLTLGLSRLTCNLVYGVSESWCARAWRLQDRSRFWGAWVRVFGRAHCHKSWRHYHT